jgi:hypothetical protein
MISHKVPLITVLEDREERTKEQRAVYDVWRAGGAPTAFRAFLNLYGPQTDAAGANGSSGAIPGGGPGLGGLVAPQDKPGNLMYWFERELL